MIERREKRVKVLIDRNDGVESIVDIELDGLARTFLLPKKIKDRGLENTQRVVGCVQQIFGHFDPESVGDVRKRGIFEWEQLLATAVFVFWMIGE